MSWAAMNYVRRLKRDSGIVNNIRLVLLMIAWRIPKGCIESKPIPLSVLMSDTVLDKKTVRACIRKACTAGHLRIGQAGGPGRGRCSTYVMPHLAGPLFMVAGDEEKGGDSPPIDEGTKGGTVPPFTDARKGGISPPFGPEKGEFRPRSVRTSAYEDVRTKTSTTTAAKPAAAAISALEFLDWFVGAYTEHNKGRVTVDVEVDGPKVVRLLTTPERSVALLQAMALAMWTVTVAEDPWLAAAKDRGLQLLGHAADRLERIAIERQDRRAVRPACRYKHEPPCVSPSACAELERRLLQERDGEEEAVG